MACGSGCCQPPLTAPSSSPSASADIAPPSLPQEQQAAQLQAEDTACEKSCCSGSELGAPSAKKSAGSGADCCAPPVNTSTLGGRVSSIVDGKDGCCSTLGPSDLGSAGSACCKSTDKKTSAPEKAHRVEPSCKDECCAGPKSTSPERLNSVCCESTGNDAAPKESAETKMDCEDRCCAPSEPSVSKTADPPCCEGKPSPCCDTSCLDRLAQRSCDSSSECGNEREEGKPCKKHLLTVRERYNAWFEVFKCLCRDLVAQGQDSCCVSAERSSYDRAERKRTSQEKARTSVDSCCASPYTSSISKTCGQKNVRKRRSKDSCCVSSRRSFAQDACGKGCCGQPKTGKPPSPVDPCPDACCSGGESKPKACKDILGTVSHRMVDSEKGLTGSEHVVLSISGMTCTGCETKLNRTLAGVQGISNLKASLILSRAEFDLDIATNTATDVMKHLERTTEFTCERVTNEGSTIDVIPPMSCEEFIKQDYPAGVAEMVLVDKETVRIAFDAKIVGARDLCSHGFGEGTPLKLAPPRPDPTLEAGSKHVRHLGYMTILSAMLTVPVLVLAWAPLPEHEIAYSSTSLALATIIQVVIAGPFYPTSLKSLIFSRVIEMDLLIVLSTTAAYVFSIVAFGFLVAGKPLSTGEFFETSTLLVTLIMVGRYVGALARQKAVESISVRSLQTPEAVLVGSDGQESVIDARLLQYGDLFKVMPDSRVPTDGTVISGTSEVDESMVTGESTPVLKEPKSMVIAGSINGPGALVVRLTRLPGDNTISAIASMVDEAKLSKPKIQEMADKVASYFVPVVLLLTILTFAVWVAVGVAVRHQSGSEAVANAITFAISVLIVSCPCAIGLAVPMVVVIATGVAADRGVIFKTAQSIEIAHKASHVVFDKTGTLTEGKLTVVSEEWVDPDDYSAAGLLLGLVGSNKHPVSIAVATHLKSRPVTVAATEVKDARTLSGKGVEATCAVSGRALQAGNSRWLDATAEPSVAAVLGRGRTTFCFAIDGVVAAVFGLEDAPRPDATEAISRLRARGIDISLLSGDDDGAVRAAARHFGIPDDYVRSRCSPADKRAYVQALQQPPPVEAGENTPRPAVVIFCGDGTNDAAALAQSDIGIHVGGSDGGTDVASGAADVVLLRPRPGGVVTTIDASRAAHRRILFNFAWSFVYNVFAVLLAAGAFSSAGGGGDDGVRIPPQFAGLGELVSVLPVVAAAVALRWARI